MRSLFQKIAKDYPILIKLTLPNGVDFSIFKTSRFFEFMQILMAESGLGKVKTIDLEFFVDESLFEMPEKTKKLEKYVF